MEFEVTNALRDLHNRTPEYLLTEIFSHGELKVREDALKILKDLDPDKHTGRVLQEMIRIG